MNGTGQRVAMITGASRGLGLALARSLGPAGWSLVIDARGAGPLERARAELASHTTVRAIPGDVADESHRLRLIEEAGRLGGLDLLVNNASLLGPSPQPNLERYPLDVLDDRSSGKASWTSRRGANTLARYTSSRTSRG